MEPKLAMWEFKVNQENENDYRKLYEIEMESEEVI